MGCSYSTGEQTEIKTPEIQSVFKKTSIPQYDSFYEILNTAFERAEKIRSDILSVKRRCERITNTFKLKDSDNFINDIKVFVWSLSVNAGGDIQKFHVRTTTDLPYLLMDESLIISLANKALYEIYKEYMKLSTNSFRQVRDIMTEVDNKEGKIKEMTKNLGKEETNGKISIFKRRSLKKTLQENKKIYLTALEKTKELLAHTEKLKNEVETNVKLLNDIIQTADVIGKKAVSMGITDPKDIFDKFHTGERKSNENQDKSVDSNKPVDPNLKNRV